MIPTVYYDIVCAIQLLVHFCITRSQLPKYGSPVTVRHGQHMLSYALFGHVYSTGLDFTTPVCPLFSLLVASRAITSHPRTRVKYSAVPPLPPHGSLVWRSTAESTDLQDSDVDLRAAVAKIFHKHIQQLLRVKQADDLLVKHGLVGPRYTFTVYNMERFLLLAYPHTGSLLTLF